MQELQTHDAAHDRDQTQQPRGRHGLAEHGHAVDRRAHGADADPDRIAGADRGRPQGEGQAIERQPVAVMTTSDGPSCVNPSAAFKAGVTITSQRMAASR